MKKWSGTTKIFFIYKTFRNFRIWTEQKSYCSPQFFHNYNWCKNQTYNYFPTVCFYTPELRVHNTVHTKQCMNANGISKIATYLFENILCCHFFFFCVCDILRLYARLMKKRPSFRKTKIRKLIYISCFFSLV